METIKLECATLNPIQELEGEIEYLNDEYRQGTPQVSDQEYDAMLARLAELAPDHPLLKKAIIEKAPNNPRMRPLSHPMMSLNKAKSLAEIRDWLSDLDPDTILVVTGKYNGISLLVDPEKMTASTRGDGAQGQNCDKHFLKMPVTMSAIFNEIVSGEAIISRENWKDHFEGKIAPSGRPYKLNNATVAGLLNSDEPATELQYVEFVPYNVHCKEMRKRDQLRAINRSFVHQTKFILTTVGDLDADLLNDFYQTINEEYPCDGLVIDIDDADLRQKMGYLSNGNPNFARALKLDKWVEEFDTIITGYNFTISKQGKLKGVITFNPVFINGTEVKQASFYNALFLHEMDLCPGVRITIKKSGEIIPKIVAVEGVRIPVETDYKEKASFDWNWSVACDQISRVVAERYEKEEIDFDWSFFNTCPSCGNGLIWDQNNVELLCTASNCRSMIISKIEHFFLTIGVEELGRPSIETLYDAGFNTIEKIWNISKNQICQIEGFGESSADTFLSQFTAIKVSGLPLARLMYAWDLFEGKIGEKTIQLILDNIEDLNGLAIEKLVKIKGVSDITAICFMEGLKRYNDVSEIIPISYVTSPRKAITNARYAGFYVCFSGVRDADLEEEIKLGSGAIASGVSKLTTHLVVADVNQVTSKTDKARENKIPILTIEQFKAL